MMRTEETTVERGAICAVLPDGRRLYQEHKVTRVSDIRDTPFGPIDFGYVTWGPWYNVWEPA